MGSSDRNPPATHPPTAPRVDPRRRSAWRLGWRGALLVLALPLSTNPVWAQKQLVSGPDIEELMRRGGCMLCHRWSRPWIGPSFKEIAQQYRGASNADRDVLVQRLRRGSVGNHTPIPMGPCDITKLNDDELRLVIDHLLNNGLRKDLPNH